MRIILSLDLVIYFKNMFTSFIVVKVLTNLNIIYNLKSPKPLRYPYSRHFVSSVTLFLLTTGCFNELKFEMELYNSKT